MLENYCNEKNPIEEDVLDNIICTHSYVKESTSTEMQSFKHSSSSLNQDSIVKDEVVVEDKKSTSSLKSSSSSKLSKSSNEFEALKIDEIEGDILLHFMNQLKLKL